jgi:hypothetical protein
MYLGSWILDMAVEYPQAQYYGSDLTGKIHYVQVHFINVIMAEISEKTCFRRVITQKTVTFPLEMCWKTIRLERNLTSFR